MVVYLTCFSLTLILKGTVSVILSEPPCKDDIARFITLHLKALIIEQNWGADMKTATAIAVLQVQTQNINQLTINLPLVIMIYQCFCVNN